MPLDTLSRHEFSPHSNIADAEIDANIFAAVIIYDDIFTLFAVTAADCYIRYVVLAATSRTSFDTSLLNKRRSDRLFTPHAVIFSKRLTDDESIIVLPICRHWRPFSLLHIATYWYLKLFEATMMIFHFLDAAAPPLPHFQKCRHELFRWGRVSHLVSIRWWLFATLRLSYSPIAVIFIDVLSFSDISG